MTAQTPEEAITRAAERIQRVREAQRQVAAEIAAERAELQQNAQPVIPAGEPELAQEGGG